MAVWKGKLNTKLCVLLDYSYKPKFFKILAIDQKYFSFYAIANFFMVNSFSVDQVGSYIDQTDFSQGVTSQGTFCHVVVFIANLSKFQNFLGKWGKFPGKTHFQGVF